MNLDSLEISTGMLKLIAEIDEFKGRWTVLETLSPDRLASLRKVATIESIGSSTRIEGAKLSDREVEALLANLDMHAFTSRDEQEVAGYAEAMDQIFLNYDNILLTENYIKQLHQMLLKYSNKDERHRGQYKKLSNNVEAFDANGKSLGVIFATTTPFETPEKMRLLVEWLQQSIADQLLHPLLIVGIFVVCFLAIHPFQDGNGRLSRVLTTLLLLKLGYTYVPYSSLEAIVEDNKDQYYLALRRTQQTLNSEKSNFDPWLQFFLLILKKQTSRLKNKMDEKQYSGKELSSLPAKIVELARQQERITIADIEAAIDANRNTVKKHLQQLVKQGRLAKHGKARATWYVLVE